jgi:hypothetical protein
VTDTDQAPRGPAFHFAELADEQRRVYRGERWMMLEAARRYAPWLEQEAPRIARRKKRLCDQMVQWALDRLVEVDLTRFDEEDWPWLEKALRAELRWAMVADERCRLRSRTDDDENDDEEEVV